MKKIIVFLLCLTMGTSLLFAQDIERNIKERLTDYFAKYTATAKISTPKLNSFDIDYDRRTIQIYASESFAYQPFLPETVETIYNQMKELLPGPVNYYQITIYADGKPIEELVPNLYRSKKKDKERMALNTEYKGAPWVKNTSRPNEISRGLQDRHIALWQSHGNYYKNDKGEWGWQRPRLFCTTEDMFTQSFILPYVIPMLENAGAIVYTPRERDTQKNEIIVDNDTPNASLYLEVGSKKARWTTTSVKGFAQKKAIYKDGENPFTDGTSRYIQTEKKKKKNKDQAFAEWVPTLPATGKYAVYVSYQTLPNSVSDAKYLVFHNGGVTEFKVNQKIGGGIGGVVVHAIIAYKFGDLYAPLMEDYFELDGITVPHGTGTWMAPFAFAIDAIIEKIPGLNKIDFSIDNLQEKVGVLAEPIVIGGILGAIVGALAGYDFSAAFQLGIKMSAVMVLMPKITKCIMDGLMPLSERMKEILTKKSQSGEAEFYIGLDPAIILGDSEVVTVGLIFIPLTILIAIIVPGNTILPFGDLATIGFFIGIAVAVHRGNLFRSLISGCVIMFTTIWIASQAIPWTTALAKSVNLTNGASQVAALDQGGSPITYLYTQIVTQQNIKGLVIIGIIYVICMIFTVRGSKQRAAALKESEY